MKILIFLIILFEFCGVLYGSPQYIDTREKRQKDIKSRKIRVFGNKILTEEKIKEIINPSTKEMTYFEMTSALKRLEDIYLSQGYDLVEISYLILMGEWYVFINEGRVGKVIIKGENTLNTLLLKNVFVFTENTFNSVELRRLIESAKKNYGFKRIQYKILPIKGNRKSLLGLSEKFSKFVITELPESYIEPNYDLLIMIKKQEWGDGFGGFITYNSFGLVSGLSYSDSSLLLSGDRFKAVLKGGLNSRTDLDDKETNIIFTLASLDLIYYPSFIRLRYFKPNIESSTSDTSYMRGDIPLNEYRIFSQDLSLFAGFELKKNLILSYGFGEEFLYTHNFDYVKGYEEKIRGIKLFRSYLSLALNYLIDEPYLRSDFRENLKTKVRYYIPSDNESHWLISSDYTKSLIFGYDYMKFASGFKVLTGDIPFFDEFSVAYSAFKSSFSDRYYAREAFYISLEYNFSLYKDILHLGVFSDFTIFYYKNYRDKEMYWLGAVDGGGGLRLLVIDMFLIKADYVEAAAFNKERDNLFLFSASKVF